MTTFTAPFQSYTLTDEDVRAEGYQTGLAWDRAWAPGGPWVPQPNAYRCDPLWVAYCNTCKRHRRIWLDAWAEGLAVQQK